MENPNINNIVKFKEKYFELALGLGYDEDSLESSDLKGGIEVLCSVIRSKNDELHDISTQIANNFQVTKAIPNSIELRLDNFIRLALKENNFITDNQNYFYKHQKFVPQFLVIKLLRTIPFKNLINDYAEENKKKFDNDVFDAINNNKQLLFLALLENLITKNENSNESILNYILGENILSRDEKKLIKKITKSFDNFFYNEPTSEAAFNKIKKIMVDAPFNPLPKPMKNPFGSGEEIEFIAKYV